MSLCTNKKALHDYEILESLEAGIVLHGHEVKSVAAHNCSLDGSYAVVRDGEVWLIGANIEEYKNRVKLDIFEPNRDRKLLLHKREIDKFAGRADERGLTLVPISLYFKSGKIKVQLAIAKGRQLHDKREVAKKKEAEKEIRNY